MSTKERTARLQKLETQMKVAEKAVEDPKATERPLERKKNQLVQAWLDYDEAHNDAVLKEKDEDQKDILQDDHEKVVEKYDAVIDPIEELIHKLTKKDEVVAKTPTISSEQMRTLKTNRCKSTIDEGMTRITRLTTKLDSMINPNKSQLESITMAVMNLRTELVNQMIAEHDDLAQLFFLASELEEIDQRSRNSVIQIHERLDEIVAKIIEKTPDTPALNATNVMDTTNRSFSANQNSASTYKSYAKESIPTFKGQLRQYPAWRKEMKELVLPDLQEVHQIRILDKHTPQAVDLQNCESIDEAWKELDSKYGNAVNITAVLMDDFFKTVLKGRSDESRLVETKVIVVRLSSDLVAVSQKQVLHDNPYAINHIVKLMPRFWQNKWSESKGRLMENGKTLWQAISGFLKDEALRLETELPWTLDSFNKNELKQSKPLNSTESAERDADQEEGKKDKKRINALKKKEKWVTNKDDSEENDVKKSARFDEMKDKFGKCPHCNEHHTWTSPRNKELLASDSLRNCEIFLSQTPQQRAAVVEKHKVCAYCLSWSHERVDCKRKEKRPCGRSGCQLLHNTLLHGTQVAYVNTMRETQPSRGVECKVDEKSVHLNSEDEDEYCTKFLHILSHPFPEKNLSLDFLLDDGSDICLITHRGAGFLGLKGKKRMTYLMTAGQDEAEGKMMLHYQLPVTCNDGIELWINCVGVDCITENSSKMTNIAKAYELFPHVPKGALDRPVGEVSIMIGQDQAALLASGGTGKDVRGNLRAMQTKLGSGWVLGGWHKDIRAPPLQFSSSTNLLRQSRLVCKPMRVNLIRNITHWPELLETSCQLPRKCVRCVGCQACRHEVQEATRQEQRELEMIKKSIVYDEEKKRCVVSYPILGDTSLLKNNEWQAKAMAVSLERQLKKRDQIEAYNKEFLDYIDRKVIVTVSREEIDDWQRSGGVINYISHHGVETPHKATTKTRLVSNSSLPNAGKGPSVNAYWVKGPMSLKPMIEVFLRFRAYEVACHYDIKKMYHSVPTTDHEKFMRLMIWRPNEKEDWKTYGYIVVAMGDRPAACVLELVKDKAAELGYEIDPEVATKVVEDTFVDDGLTGGSEEEVRRMMGECEQHDDGSLSYSGSIQKIFDKVGFKLKMMVRSGEKNEIALAKMGGAVLGHIWDPVEDLFSFQPRVYLGKKKKNGFHAGPELTQDNLIILSSFTWTRRTVLSTIAGIYDPAGLICPYVMKFKLFLREVCLAGEVEWDAPLPEKLQQRWVQLVTELVTSPPITVNRAVSKVGAVGPPDLVAYSDGSLSGHCAAVYYRQQTKVDVGKAWHSELLVAKSRVSPLAGVTAPRSEANGFLSAVRLTTTALRSLRRKPSRVWFILDSECTITAMESEHGHLTAYLANRRGEVLETFNIWQEEFPDLVIEPLLHTPGPLNISDLGTRDTVTADQVGMDSEWQGGPRYLSGPSEHWPVSREFVRKIPDAEVKHRTPTLVQGMINLTRIIKKKEQEVVGRLPQLMQTLLSILDYSDSITKCEGIMARVLRASRDNVGRQDVLKNMSKPLTSLDISAAREVMIRLMQPEVKEMLDSSHLPGNRRKLKKMRSADLKKEMTVGPRTYVSTINMASLAPFKENGILYTQGRFGNDLGKILGPNKLPILPPTCRLAKLMMIASHNEAHRAGGDTCFRSRSRSWTVRARPLADMVVKDCRLCMIKTKQYIGQQMGSLPEERQTFLSKPWTSTAIDLLGPYKVKAMNNSRSSLKVWPIVFCCHVTGALHTELSYTYGTDAFLVAYSSFTAVRGTPATVYTDSGSQLCKAVQYVESDDPGKWDWATVEEQTGRQGTNWRFCPPGAQHRNGLAEQRVRAMKDALDLLVPSGVNNLNFAEFSTLLRRCANLINDRPIGVRHHKPGTEGELMPLTPNHLLLGRTSTGPLDTDHIDQQEDNFSRRACFVAELESLWWKMWFRQVFDSLFPYPAWKERKPNLSVGDICLLGWEAKLGKGHYKLCRVVATQSDERGLVRTVEVEHRPKNKTEPGLPYNSKKLIKSTFAVQRLILVARADEISAGPSAEES